jgi:FKBP-type peptidyl-prolyl cis-trans isomerase FklB
MHKPFTTALVLAAGMMLPGSVLAQTPAAKTPTSAPKTAPKTPAKTGAKPAVKSGAKPAAKPAGAVALKTTKDKQSYALGMNIGLGMHKQGLDVDPEIVMQGFKDSFAGAKTALSEEEARASLTELQNDMRKKMQEKAQEASATNKKEGDAFLAANKAKEGVVTLPSGLQYKVEKEGTGPKPTASDTVVCNYKGTLINGKEFDSSYKRGEPATFPVTGVIKGWTEALQLMPVGSKWQLFIPGDLAYGERGAGADIGPGATLIFEVELMSIQDKNAATKPDDKKVEAK